MDFESKLRVVLRLRKLQDRAFCRLLRLEEHRYSDDKATDQSLDKVKEIGVLAREPDEDVRAAV